jgi:hypothetical protein
MKMCRVLIGVAICLAVAGIVLASVTFDSATGIGFVGKGDVQTALGLNNAQMQAQAASLVFTLVKVDTYEVVNAWATGNPDNPVSLNSHTQTVTTFCNVSASVLYDARTHKQVDGFNLTGWNGVPIVVGTVPVPSPTVTYVTFTWTTQEWDGTYDTVPNPNYNGHNSPTIQVKHYVDVPHESDQVPVDENGNLYTEGDNKAILSVTLVDSTGSLYVNGVQLPWPPAPVVTP